MRRYTIGINDTTKVVDVEAVGANLFRVQIDGRLVDVTLEDHRDLAHSAVTPAVVPREERTVGDVAAGAAADAPATPAPSGKAPAPLQRPTSPANAASAPVSSTTQPVGRDTMTAPMPGAILSVSVAVGDTVKRGDTLLVLEAMKMKNELKSPRDGVVAEIYVGAGTQVRFGETLVRFE